MLLTSCDVNQAGAKPPSAASDSAPEAFQDQSSPQSDGIDSLISSLERKYGESFTLLENAGGGAGLVDHCAVYVRSDKFPDDRIYAVRGVFDGRTEERDNYMAYCLREEASAYLTGLAKSVYGECRAFYTPDKNAVLPPDIGKESSAEELLKKTKPYFSVILPEGQELDKKDKKLDDLFEKMKEGGINCFFYIAYLDSNEIYVGTSSAEGIDRSHIITDCTLGMDADFNIVERQWG